LDEAALDGLDEELARARSGEKTALASLIRVHQRSVYGLALRMLGTRELAEDLTQDVFMQLTDHLKSLTSNGHLVFWLRKVTTHRAIDQLRRRARVEFAPLEEGEHLGAVDEGDPLLQGHVRRLLLELSPPARAVMLLRYQEDMDPVDIAAMLDMPMNTVKSHLKRSLGLLRQKITPAEQHSAREDEST
jgi:RNA polymerase sigma-70 factor (ECF subfamily)